MRSCISSRADSLKTCRQPSIVFPSSRKWSCCRIPWLSPEDEAKICDFLSDVTIIDLNREIKTSAIALRRQYRLKLPDALIAATAQHLQADLYSNDLKMLAVPLLSAKALMLKRSRS